MVSLISPINWDEDENKYIISESIYNRMYAIMNKLNEEGNVFAGKKDRLDLAPISALITYNNIDVGFIYATSEFRYKDALFLDMAIIKEYRGHGIGKQTLIQFLDLIDPDEFIIGETKNNNQASNPLGDDIGVRILESEYNYYLFPKSRYEEFIEHNKDNRFEKAMLKNTKNSEEILNEIKQKQLIKK